MRVTSPQRLGGAELLQMWAREDHRRSRAGVGGPAHRASPTDTQFHGQRAAGLRWHQRVWKLLDSGPQGSTRDACEMKRRAADQGLVGKGLPLGRAAPHCGPHAGLTAACLPPLLRAAEKCTTHSPGQGRQEAPASTVGTPGLSVCVSGPGRTLCPHCWLRPTSEQDTSLHAAPLHVWPVLSAGPKPGSAGSSDEGSVGLCSAAQRPGASARCSRTRRRPLPRSLVPDHQSFPGTHKLPTLLTSIPTIPWARRG